MFFVPLNFQSEINVFRFIFPYIFCFSPLVTLVDTDDMPCLTTTEYVMVCPIFIEINSTELFENNAVDVFNVSKRKAAEKRCFNS